MFKPTLYGTYRGKDILYVYKNTQRNIKDLSEIIDEIEVSGCKLFGIFIADDVSLPSDDIIALVNAASEKTGLVLKYMNAGYEEVLSEVLSLSNHLMLHVDSVLYDIVAKSIMTRECLPEYLHIGIHDIAGARTIANAIKFRGIESIAITVSVSAVACEFMRHCGAIKSLNIIFSSSLWTAVKISELLDQQLVDVIVGASLEEFGVGCDGIMLMHDDTVVFKQILSCSCMRKFNIGENISDGTMKNIIDAIITARHLTDVVIDSNIHDREILRLITDTNLHSITLGNVDTIYNNTRYSNDIIKAASRVYGYRQ